MSARKDLARDIVALVAAGRLSPEDGHALLHRAGAPSAGAPGPGEPIAVVGMAGRFPQAPDLDAFWSNIAAGRNCVSEVPPERWDGAAWYDPDPARLDRTHCRWGGFLADVDQFDPFFFGMSLREAAVTDPQQRLFLEASWRALEDGGYAGPGVAGANVGVFAGAGMSDYLTLMEDAGVARPAQTFWGNETSVLAARIAYILDLRGPAVTLETACSSSLVAIHQACEALRAGTCSMALAGGVFVRHSQRFHIAASNAGMLSPTGRCAAFDDSADGFVPGEGAGAILLKPLSQAVADGDTIHGVIRGTGINQDGRTNGITAPSARSQTDLETAVYRRFGLDPATFSYVEAHGTGTRLGDPVEVKALTESFRAYTDRRQFCALGSVKTNIGHAAMAAGVAGVLKVLLMLRRRTLPPSLHFATPNAHIDFAASPFRVVTDLRPWQADGPLRAAVSSFGMSGTNAHVVLEEAPAAAQRKLSDAPVPLLLSARTPDLLAATARTLAEWLAGPGRDVPLCDVAHTLMVGRMPAAHRLAVVASNPAQAVAALRAGGSVGEDPLAAAFLAGEAAPPTGLPGARRVPLPPSPFEVRRVWFDAQDGAGAPSRIASPGGSPGTGMSDGHRAALIRAEIAHVLGIAPAALGDDDDLFALGLDSLGVLQVARRLEERHGIRRAAADITAARTVAALARPPVAA